MQYQGINILQFNKLSDNRMILIKIYIAINPLKVKHFFFLQGDRTAGVYLVSYFFFLLKVCREFYRKRFR